MQSIDYCGHELPLLLHKSCQLVVHPNAPTKSIRRHVTIMFCNLENAGVASDDKDSCLCTERSVGLCFLTLHA